MVAATPSKPMTTKPNNSGSAGRPASTPASAATASAAAALALAARIPKLPFLMAGIACLICGVWGGLLRLSVPVPMITEHANWLTSHGALMTGGFLGTVIALERAVGLQRPWAYLGPIATAVGGVLILFGVMGTASAWCMVAGSLLFSAVCVRIVLLQRVLFTWLMLVGALCWVIGNVQWLRGAPMAAVVLWWMHFLGLIIVGERLDLSRFQKRPNWSEGALLAAVVVLVGGSLVTFADLKIGLRILGAGYVLIAAWLLRFDIARRSGRQPGLPRFMAVALLSGFGWMAVSGALLLLAAPTESGMLYDAALHSFFLGFVMSMVFGHAPVIFPAILQLPLQFSARFYIHVGLLHLSLAVRVVGDLAESPAARSWGAILNSVAMGVFLLSTIGSVIHGVVKSRQTVRAAAEAVRRKQQPGVEGIAPGSPRSSVLPAG